MLLNSLIKCYGDGILEDTYIFASLEFKLHPGEFEDAADLPVG